MSSGIRSERTKYDITAHLYSFITGLLFILGGSTENRLRKLAYKEALILNKNDKILDICCANGKGTRIIASMIPEGKVIGIDLNPSMVAFAHSKSQNLSNVKFKIGDCAEIGCNSVLNPGTVIGAESIIYPLTNVRGVIPESMILKNNGSLVKKIKQG